MTNSPTVLPGSPAIVCRRVEKNFGKGNALVRVLRGANFDAYAGEITLLVGPSGCGKTTLISVLGGLLTPDAGEVQVFGVDLRKCSNDQLANFRVTTIGFIFQQLNLLPALTAAENAAVPLIARGATTQSAIAKASELLQRLGLEEHLQKYPHQMSGGQQQRVAIGRALVHDPRLVICDEPTSSLDAQSGRAAMDLLQSVAVKPDRAVLVVTHDDRIFRYAHRISHMADGVLTHTETQNRRGSL